MSEEKENPADSLNEKQLLFCRLYVSREFYGNGTLSYCEAYGFDPSDIKQYNSARHSASHLLNNPNISQHINNLLEEGGLNDSHIDKRLLFLINQNEDKGTALGAIKEYNKLKQRIIEKIEMNQTGIDVKKLSDETLKAIEEDLKRNG